MKTGYSTISIVSALAVVATGCAASGAPGQQVTTPSRSSSSTMSATASPTSTSTASSAQATTSSSPTPKPTTPKPTASKPAPKPTSTPAASPRPLGVSDPAAWTNSQLAAQMLMVGVQMTDTQGMKALIKGGVGAILLTGEAPAGLKAQLRSQRKHARVPIWIASDEEGGSVQRLARYTGRYPSAYRLGQMSSTKIRSTARSYGVGLDRLGVDVALSPVADISGLSGSIGKDRRSFGSDAETVSRSVSAWVKGMSAAHIASAVKHWPGTGKGGDTHHGAAKTAPLSKLKKGGLIPFRAATAAGVPMVMMGHLTVPGLTEKGVPASLSTRSYALLRSEAGPSTVLITDSLGMGAIAAAGYSQPRAAVYALRRGADMVMISGLPASRVVPVVARAIASGTIPRAEAVAKVKRILAAKVRFKPGRG